MGKIFICYRRQDSQHQAGRLYDRLVAKFGAGSVFKDVDSIPAAEKFPDNARSAIANCDVFLVLIGEHWLDIRDAAGNRRLDDADDYVRLEIEEALRQGVKAVPVLLDGASMPSKKDLPSVCCELAEINAVRVRPDPDFKHDADRLLDSLAAVIRQRKAEKQAEFEWRANEERQARAAEAALRASRRRAAAARTIVGLRSKFSNKMLIVALALVAGVFLFYAAWPEPGPQPASPAPDGPVAGSLHPNTPVPVPTAPAAHMVGEKSIANSFGMSLTLMPAGEFMMGSPASEPERRDDEGPQHPIRITRPFYLGTTEVTQSQWEAVMRTSPWHGQGYVKEGPDYPATYVSWNDAVAFCQELSQREEQTYRLPTEAEWEYACRAGTTTSYSFGDELSKLREYAWYDANASDVGEDYAHRVGQKRVNPVGLSDMHGNVFEFCSDWYAADYYAKSPPADPFGPSAGSNRVSRGGSSNHGPVLCRSANRRNHAPDYSYPYYGFRVVRVR